MNYGTLKGYATLSAARTITVTGNGGFLQAQNADTCTVAGLITGTGSTAFVGINYGNTGIVIVSNSGNNYSGDTDIGTVGPGGTLAATSNLPRTT